jgi:hypothetical protein
MKKLTQSLHHTTRSDRSQNNRPSEVRLGRNWNPQKHHHDQESSPITSLQRLFTFTNSLAMIICCCYACCVLYFYG